MPRYDFRCRECGGQFEVSRPMSEANSAALCPDGHSDTVKLLSTISLSGSASAVAGAGAPMASGVGCCGGGCCG